VNKTGLVNRFKDKKSIHEDLLMVKKIFRDNQYRWKGEAGTIPVGYFEKRLAMLR
jgi:hypothetical protein